jgi:hypothetical protein
MGTVKGEQRMPDIILNFLKTQTAENASLIWNWLDSNPSAVDEMMEILEAQHGNYGVV